MNLPEKDRLLVVEDDPDLAELLLEELEAAGYEVRHMSSVASALRCIEEWRPELVISDLRLPDGNGMDLLADVTDSDTSPAFLMITAFGTISQAVAALKAGADEFLTKPLDIDHFLLTVERLLENKRLRKEVEQYRSLMSEDVCHGLIGRSAPMQALFHQIRQIAAADGPVLILGESGTGKELVAKALHSSSDRRSASFLAVNCAGIPAELMESEFFGHVSGAFTGAGQSREGLLAQANGGTLLLDEIAEMPLALQAKLLRALQDGNIRPVGGDQEVKVDVRIMAATHQDLQQCCRDGKFREDLYFRLETFSLRVPPLRDRGTDIELLANHFLNQNRQRAQRNIKGFTSEALVILQSYRFPGNVRELQNAVDRAVAFCNEYYVDIEHLPGRMRSDFDSIPAPHDRGSIVDLEEFNGGRPPDLKAVQRQYIRHILRHTNGNKRRAADILGITRRTLYRWLEE